MARLGEKAPLLQSKLADDDRDYTKRVLCPRPWPRVGSTLIALSTAFEAEARSSHTMLGLSAARPGSQNPRRSTWVGGLE